MKNGSALIKKMTMMWDIEKNLEKFNITFENTKKSKDKNTYYWICPLNRCSFLKPSTLIYQRLYNNSALCDICNEVPFENSLAVHASKQVDKYWNHQKNQEVNIYPDTITKSSNKKVFVKCEKHNWGIEKYEKQRCADLLHHNPCPFCNGKAAHPNNNLKLKYPAIAEELHPNFNAEEILPASNKEYPWFCNICRQYYKMKVSVRTGQNQGCPIHGKGHQYSKTENLLTLILNKLLGDFSKHKSLNSTWSNGSNIEIDIYNPSLKIGIEYDGYHHKDTLESDNRKNKLLKEDKDIDLFIRVREEGLPKLTYFHNQFEIICEKHESSYQFLKPAIKETINIINERINTTIPLPSSPEIKEMIKTELIKTTKNSNHVNLENSFFHKAPGLLKLILPMDNANPKKISAGSNHKFSVSCSKCSHAFIRSAKNLISSKGRCPKCYFIAHDIRKKDSPFSKWFYKVSTCKSFAANFPDALIFYSNKNFPRATEIAPYSSYKTIWECPFCNESFISTNKKQVKNGFKCQKCNRKGIEYKHA